MNLISEGLGLKCGYFDDYLTGSMILSVNHYPRCPEPSLTLGMSKHSDPNLITILMQDDASGLQVLKDGDWIALEAHPRTVIDCSRQFTAFTQSCILGRSIMIEWS